LAEAVTGGRVTRVPLQPEPRKVLVVGPAWVGDMVMSQSLYIHLQQTRPGLILDVVAPPWSEPVLARMPQVNRSITLDAGHGEVALARRLALGRSLRAEGYEQAIVLPNSFKSALVPLFARIPRRTGWRGEMRFGLLNDLRLLPEASLPLMAQRFVALGMEPGAAPAAEVPFPRLEVDPASAALCRREFGLELDRPVLSLCPGAEFGSAKRWPPAFFAALAREYLGRGWQVVLYGSGSDRDVCRQIWRDSGALAHCHDLAGRTSLAQVVDMLSLSSAVVSNDSGLMHIAAAVGCPLVVVYGATSPGFTPPLSRQALVITSDLDCAPCFQRECPLGHHRCMRDTRPAQVAAKLDALLMTGGPVD